MGVLCLLLDRGVDFGFMIIDGKNCLEIVILNGYYDICMEIIKYDRYIGWL